MTNLKIHKQTHDKADFLKGWYLSDISLCDQIIEYYERNTIKWQGKIGKGVDKTIKDSVDCQFVEQPLLNNYLIELQKVVDEYIKTYPYVDSYMPWKIIEDINIQKYDPNKAYYGWHTERIGRSGDSIYRHLVFMTYLNDIAYGGETAFYHQDTKVKPEKGLTLIWPSDWTYTHRGYPALKETKYIVTGWFNYVNEEGKNDNESR